MKIGVIGGAGYTAGELLRLLVNHPEAEIAFVHSSSNAGKPVAAVHSGLFGDTDLVFSDTAPLEGLDCLFLCCGHGDSRRWLEEHDIPEELKIIDLSQDYRDQSNGFVYGLPEWQRQRIAGATRIANPGCFATAIQLALLPLAAAGKLDSDVEITALTGSTGAGVKPTSHTHFSYRANNISTYKEFTHQHLLEIGRTLTALQPDFRSKLDFVPMRGDFPRGIFASLVLRSDLTQTEAQKLFEDYYADAAFTHVTPQGWDFDLKQVVNTNKALLRIEKHGDRLHIISAIDNLLKGASGQAVQNMNIIFGLDERTGLKLKATGF